MIYGNKFLNLQEDSEVIETKEMTTEEYYQYIIESLVSLEDTIESLEESEDTLQEGANIDYIKELTSIKKEIKAKTKELKRFKKEKDKKNFIKTAEEAIKVLENGKKAINKIDPSMGSTVLSVILKIIKFIVLFNTATKTLYTLPTAIGAVTGTAIWGTAIFSTPFPTFDNVPNEKQWNQYRKNAIMYIESTITNTKNLIRDTKNW